MLVLLAVDRKEKAEINYVRLWSGWSVSFIKDKNKFDTLDGF